MIGQCPRKYFFNYGLKIAPPEDVSTDPDRWLDALSFGSLIHELFEGFVREVIAEGRVLRFDADYPRLRELLQAKVREHENLYPPLNDASFQRRVTELEQTARTFLREDERYCQNTHSVPVYLEASIGLRADGHGTDLDTLDRVPLTLPNGKVIQVRGRVDRVDRIGSGAVHTSGIWDYKSGGTWGYDRADLLRQGRKVHNITPGEPSETFAEGECQRSLGLRHPTSRSCSTGFPRRRRPARQGLCLWRPNPFARNFLRASQRWPA